MPLRRQQAEEIKVRVSASPPTLCDLGTSVSSLVKWERGEKDGPQGFFSSSDLESVPIRGHGPGAGKLCNRDHSTQLRGKHHRFQPVPRGAFHAAAASEASSWLTLV